MIQKHKSSIQLRLWVSMSQALAEHSCLEYSSKAHIYSKCNYTLTAFISFCHFFHSSYF